MKFSRRQFIQGSLDLALLDFPPLHLIPMHLFCLKRKFIFLRVPGGWDTTRVLAPMFSNPNIDMENEAELRILEDISLCFSSRSSRVNRHLFPRVRIPNSYPQWDYRPQY